MPRERYSPQEQDFYRRYLQSKQWRDVKAARIKQAGGRCEWAVQQFEPSEPTAQRCARRRYLCVHHNDYSRLGAEYPGDLDVYCWFHHLLEHLLWTRCYLCGNVPCLGDEIEGEKWLNISLSSMGIDLDSGPTNWKRLPNKEFFMAQLPKLCPGCYANLNQVGNRP